MSLVYRLARDPRGSTVLEYVLIGSMVAVVVIVSVPNLDAAFASVNAVLHRCLHALHSF